MNGTDYLGSRATVYHDLENGHYHDNPYAPTDGPNATVDMLRALGRIVPMDGTLATSLASHRLTPADTLHGLTELADSAIRTGEGPGFVYVLIAVLAGHPNLTPEDAHTITSLRIITAATS